jgi:uncharacterized protein
MELLLNISNTIWTVAAQMSPYLLFGFLVAGLLSAFISPQTVERHLSGTPWKSSIKAALFGVPMPICSCGVIPLAATLRKHGASRGATAAFLASTPQTGVDSLMITYALLGWIFALFRAVVAFLSGIFCGLAVEAVSPKTDNHTPENSPAAPKQVHKSFSAILRYGFITLPRDISKSILIGIALSGLISALVPDNYFADNIGHSPIAMLIMLLIGIPLYVCSAGSVPIALAFIKAGISPGAALVFLITGPATNAATLTTLWAIIGKKQLVLFLITLSLTALGAGFIMNLIAPSIGFAETSCTDHESLTLFHHLSAGILLLILLYALKPAPKTKACCKQ